MATEPNEVRRITLRRLQEDLAADDALAINLLDVLTRYIKQMRSRGPEMLRVESLPDIPLSVTKIAKAQKAASPFLVRKSKRYIKLYIASDSKREGMRWLLNVEGAFSLCSCPSELQIILIRASRLKNITINEKNAYELKGKFLDDLHNNAFNGTNGKDAVEHIEYYLNITDPIELPNVDHDKLRVVVFPISLAGGARR
ncbi:hypothetical protein Tco_0213054 [Tanacetum coccineum]